MTLTEAEAKTLHIILRNGGADADAAYRALMEAAEQAAADRRNAEGEAHEQINDEDRPDANDLRVDLYGDTADHGDR